MTSASWRSVLAETAATVGDTQHARWMCEIASGADDADDFAALLDDEPTARMIAHLDAMIVRARAGEPLQYVLGRWGFRRLDLAVDRRALIPRPETELVAEVAIGLAAGVTPPRVVADLGTGTGAIGLAVADELPVDGTTVWITDADTDALDLARSNLAGLGRSGRNVHVAHGSWLDALPRDVRFDVIVANPPYVADDEAIEATVGEWEPHAALFAGPDGLDDLRVIIERAPGRLVAGGWLVLEIGATQGPAVAQLLTAAGFIDVEIRPDLAGRDRIALGRKA
ncbi:MAG: peptide chain release factor N(5)-glutamine methyltransferase [Actinomycetota bacterium]